MKHIKNISELKSSTYQSAADQLKRKGHIRRVSNLEDWAGKRKAEELEVVKKEMIDRIKSIGKFKIYIEEDILADFYLHFEFDELQFKDRFRDWICGDIDSLYIDLNIGIIPVLESEEDKKSFYNSYFYANRYTKHSNEYYKSVGLTQIGEIQIHLGFMPSKTEYFPGGIGNDVDDEIDFDQLYNIWRANKYDERIPRPVNPRGSVYIDSWSNIKWSLDNRREAVKFRKALIDIFKGNVEYDSNTNKPGGLKAEVMDFLIPDFIEFDYFIEWIDSLNSINVNRLYKD